MTRRFDLLCVFSVVCLTFVRGQRELKEHQGPVPVPVDEDCLQCLCDATSGCNVTIGCENYLCGPFQITQPYWLDAGKPVKRGQRRNSPSAYADCANDLECSGRAVTAYMKRYAKDCNQDGEINCVDYHSIHRLGFGNCGSALDQKYYYKFAECFHKASQKHTNDVGPRGQVLARSGIPTSP